MPSLINSVLDIAKEAGDKIMEVYASDFSQYEKDDKSPLTEADLAAHKIICERLAQLSDYPILSEESGDEAMDWNIRKDWNTYWLVDPLDGTKEFINKNDEFTVNIALINKGKAVMGVVYCPPLERFYYADPVSGAFRKDGESEAKKISVAPSPSKGEQWKVVGSRRHGAEALEKFAEQLGDVETVSMGSSLKLCLVAEGIAHLYPRLAPTCEWDTGAAQAVVEAAGGFVLTPKLQPLSYGKKEDLLNPFFIVCGEPQNDWGYVFQELAST